MGWASAEQEIDILIIFSGDNGTQTHSMTWICSVLLPAHTCYSALQRHRLNIKIIQIDNTIVDQFVWILHDILVIFQCKKRNQWFLKSPIHETFLKTITAYQLRNDELLEPWSRQWTHWGKASSLPGVCWGQETLVAWEAPASSAESCLGCHLHHHSLRSDPGINIVQLVICSITLEERRFIFER